MRTDCCGSGEVLSVVGPLPSGELAFRLGSLPDPLAAVPRAGLAPQPPTSPSKAPASYGSSGEPFLPAALQLLSSYLLDTEVGVIRITQSTIRHARFTRSLCYNAFVVCAGQESCSLT